MYIIKGSKIYNISIDKKESDEIFYERVKFIIKQTPSSEEELKKIIIYSRIWSNIKFKKCTYSEEIMNIIKKLDNN
jgi:hypothetical protein